jgi:origin recognition complex subunit 1
VHEVVRKLQEQSSSGDLPEFQFVEVNGMQLADPMQVYTQIYQVRTSPHAATLHLLCSFYFAYSSF